MFTNINRHLTNLDWLALEKSPCQAKTNIAQRLADTITFAFLGAVGGVLLSGVGSVISSSPVGIAAAIIIGIAIGSYAGRISGGIIGGIYGVLTVGVGSLISSTTLGVSLTILACACLAAWCTWTQCDIVVARESFKASNVEKRESLVARRRSAVIT